MIMEHHPLPLSTHGKSISKASHRVTVAGSQGMRQAGYCLNLEQGRLATTFQGCVVCLQEAQPFSTPFCSFFFLRGNHFLPQWGEDLRLRDLESFSSQTVAPRLSMDADFPESFFPTLTHPTQSHGHHLKDVSAEKEIAFQAEMPQMSQVGHPWERGDLQRPQGQVHLPSQVPEEKSWCVLDETELYTPNYNARDQAPAVRPWGQIGEHSESADSRASFGGGRDCRKRNYMGQLRLGTSVDKGPRGKVQCVCVWAICGVSVCVWYVCAYVDVLCEVCMHNVNVLCV